VSHLSHTGTQDGNIQKTKWSLASPGTPVR